MICKNEATTIARAIGSVRPWLTAFELGDTGSADQTIEIASTLLAGLKGNITIDAWRDFSHNRNLVMERARQYCLPILFLDCDDELVPLSDDSDANNWDILTVWAYDGSIRHRRILALNPDFKARWQGSIHEELVWPDLPTPKMHHTAVFAVKYHHDGARNTSGNATTMHDLQVLRTNIAGGRQTERSQYYLARTLHQGEMLDEAMLEYEKYLQMRGGDDDTAFHSLWSLAAIFEAVGREKHVVLEKLEQAHRVRPQRVEPLVTAARIHREAGDPESAFEYCLRALSAVGLVSEGKIRAQIPDDDFVDISYYGWRLYDELATNALLTGKKDLGREALCLALASPYLPSHARTRISLNNLHLG